METVAKLKTQLADFIGPYQNPNYCQKTAIFSDKGFISSNRRRYLSRKQFHKIFAFDNFRTPNAFFMLF